MRFDFGRFATALLAVFGLGCLSITDAQMPMTVSTENGGGGFGYTDDRTRIEVVSTVIGGKNVFVPGTVVVTAGTGRSLSFFNTTDKPHGMKIPGLGIEAILPHGEEYVIELPELLAGHVYEMQCHLHPPHRGAALVVLPAAP